MNNIEGGFAKNAVKGIASANPLAPRRGMLKKGVKGKKEEPLKVKSTRIVDEPEKTLPPIQVTATRIPQKAIGAPPPKKTSKPRKPRDVKYTQQTLPGMRNKRQFKGKSGKP
jgi:hypothetical protein